MLAPLAVLTDEPGCEMVSEETVIDRDYFGKYATITTWTLPDITKGEDDFINKSVVDG